MTSLIYNSALDHVVRGAIDFEADDFRVMLLTSRYVPMQRDAVRADVMAYEAVGEGYAVGGQPVTVAIVPDESKQGIAIRLGGAVGSMPPSRLITRSTSSELAAS